MHKKLSLKRAVMALLIAGVIIGITGAAYGPMAEEETVRTFTLIADGETRSVETTARTLAEALDELEIQVGQHDKVFPEPETVIYNGMRSRVMRIEIKMATVDEAIARQTIRQASSNLRAGHSRISNPGEDGLAKVTYKLTYADGERVLKERMSSEVVRPAKPRLVEYGEGSVLPSRGFFSRQVLTMNASAYDPGPKSCGPYADGRTATGMQAGKGVVAVDPNVIPLGTKLFIEGYGFAVAGDVGSAIRGKKIDLGHNSYAAAMRFGRRAVVVHILDE